MAKREKVISTSPMVSELVSAELYSSVLLCPGGAGLIDLFTTPLGQNLPHLFGSPPLTRAVNAETSRWRRFFSPGAPAVEVARVDHDRMFRAYTRMTTNVVKSAAIAPYDRMSVKKVRTDFLSGSSCDVSIVCDQTYFNLQVGGKSVLSGALRDLPRVPDPSIPIDSNDTVVCALEVMDVLDLHEPVLVRFILEGLTRMDVR